MVDYGPFRSKDIVGFVMKFPGVIGLSSVSKSFRKLLGDPKEKLRVILTTEDLKEGSEKIKFAVENDLMVSINYLFDNQEEINGSPQSLFTPQESYNQFISCIKKNHKLLN